MSFLSYFISPFGSFPSKTKFSFMQGEKSIFFEPGDACMGSPINCTIDYLIPLQAYLTLLLPITNLGNLDGNNDDTLPSMHIFTYISLNSPSVYEEWLRKKST